MSHSITGPQLLFRRRRTCSWNTTGWPFREHTWELQVKPSRREYKSYLFTTDTRSPVFPYRFLRFSIENQDKGSVCRIKYAAGYLTRIRGTFPKAFTWESKNAFRFIKYVYIFRVCVCEPWVCLFEARRHFLKVTIWGTSLVI